jgi:hypothetical protein
MVINPVTIRTAILIAGVGHRAWVIYSNYKRIRRMMNASAFRQLTEAEAREFVGWARANYKPFSEISAVWHPVIQQECANMNVEAVNAKENSDGVPESTASE